MKNSKTKQLSLDTLVKSAILGALAFIIMFIESPIPIFPEFLKFDFSEIPVLLAGFSIGPIGAILVELVKNILHLFITKTSGVGEMANFFVGIFFTVPAAMIYKRNKTKKGAIISLIVGSLSMVIFASLYNYFVLIPLYIKILGIPLNTIVEMGASANKYITDLKSLIIFGVAPFNALKAFVISFITVLIYKKVSPILHKKF